MEVSNGECGERGERGRTYACVCGEGFTSNQFCIQCDHCKEWFHGLCVGLHEFEADEMDKFYCQACHYADQTLVCLSKPITNNWRHNRTELNPVGKPVQSGTQHFIQVLKSKKFNDAKSDDSVVKRMRGQQLTIKELLLNGFNVPILVESKDGLELTVPSSCSFNSKSILDHYSSDYMLDVIDVTRQMNIKMKTQDFVNKLSVDPNQRPDVYNCISLEISNRQSFSNLVRAPNIVNKLSWVENYWPAVDARPQVSKYCLISMKNSFTDFHIDFGGTSVWYHVLSGEKVFYIIKPNSQNLDQYEKWMASSASSDKFLVDLVGDDQCYRLTLSAGHTLLIPTGWIHAVLTPQDSLVFGGNFLHSLNIELQLKVRQMEQRIKTPAKFQFPFFELTHWYAAPNVLKLLQDNLKQMPPKHLVSGVTALIPQLKLWLKKSRDAQNQTDHQNEYEMLCSAPKGFNCLKLIKDLNLTLKKAIRKLEGQPLVKKRGKSYKDFNLEANELPISSAQMSANLNECQLDLEDRDLPLVVDDSTKAADRKRSQSTDSESKGSLKLKLSISGAKEILGTNQLDCNQMDSIVKNDDSFALKTTLNLNIESDSTKNKKKRKKDSSDQQMDDEIESMVKGRPEDDDYIYLDLETAADEEVKNKPKMGAKDEAWAPKAKVTIKATPKAPRQPRDAAKRDVVETSIANAAAKMENMPQPKRQYIRKKPKVPKSAIKTEQTDTISTPVTVASPDIESSSIASVASNLTDSPSTAAGASASAAKTAQAANSQLIRKAKKGLKTPKQRLHKIICQKKRLHF